jgi:hypothetical protein
LNDQSLTSLRPRKVLSYQRGQDAAQVHVALGAAGLELERHVERQVDREAAQLAPVAAGYAHGVDVAGLTLPSTLDEALLGAFGPSWCDFRFLLSH